MKTVVTKLRALHCVMAPLLICIYLTRPEILFAQNILDRTGNPTATPLVAFSLRQLSSAYTGNAIQVRRSSDNSSMDIGFTAAGDLDTVKLKNFVGSGDGYVTTWYDQSGNGLDATQPNLALQPTVMVGGTIKLNDNTPQVIRIVPNPVENEAVIGCIVPVSGPVEVQLRDMTGIMMIHRTFTAKKGENVLRLTNLNGVPRGTYIMRLVQGEAVGIGKVIKQ
ncbi:hypothetical protein A3860_11600 [Niastella vici]|uniref:Alpha-L-arabinofuranosidase B catalytic domain-containing protein n=1 Tax=Niastella vici TaxID=1703345 RepID=A0A1V9FFR7_9BACT|nr:T9SS type A sorting domain-containing protein [Niastella vici]OQP57198.1 hypothetical protein A3860_11600 [Niastella vici]